MAFHSRSGLFRGGFVKDCIDAGHLAIGMEGSDYSKIHRRAEWITIPDYLFTCDVTGDFDIWVDVGQGAERLQFDVVTAWEMIEHIAEEDIDRVADNVSRHLKPGGLWIMSVSPKEETIDGVRTHQTVKPREWWIEKFHKLGFIHKEDYVRYFNTQFVRGPKYGGPGSFHLVLTQNEGRMPAIPMGSLKAYLLDRWLGSNLQRLLRTLVVGFE